MPTPPKMIIARSALGSALVVAFALTSSMLVPYTAVAESSSAMEVVATSDTWEGGQVVELDGGASFDGIEEVSDEWYVSSNGDEHVFTWGEDLAGGLPEVDDAAPALEDLEVDAVAAQVCSLLVSSPLVDADFDMYAETLVTCTEPGLRLSQGYFQRQGAIFWSTFGPTFTDEGYESPFVSRFSRPCGTTGPYDYRFRARASATGIGPSAWYNGEAATYYCGT